MIPVYRPYLPKDAFQYAQEAFESSWVSSQGKFLKLAAEKLQEMFNIKHALLTNNGTAAVHLVAKSLKFKYPNIKTIIVPNNVFIIALNAFLYDKEYKLIACEADLNTWNYDLNKLDKLLVNAVDTACLIVPNIGNIVDVPILKQKYPHIIFVEDNCEGFSGKYSNNQYSGTAGLSSAVSFYGNKSLTTGEGGVFFTNDSDVYEFSYCMHNCGQSKTRFIHDLCGLNYRMTNVQAALLLKQLEFYSEIKEKKYELFKYYRKEIETIEGTFNQQMDDFSRNPHWMFGLRIDKKISKGFDHANLFFKNKQIEIRPMFYPLTSHKYLLNNELISLCEEDVAKQLNNDCIILPSYPDLSNDEQKYIISSLKEYINLLKS